MLNAIPQDSHMPCKAPRSFSSTNSRRALTCALLECFARSIYCLILQLAAIADTGLVPVLWKLGGKCSVSSGAYPSPLSGQKHGSTNTPFTALAWHEHGIDERCTESHRKPHLRYVDPVWLSTAKPDCRLVLALQAGILHQQSSGCALPPLL